MNCNTTHYRANSSSVPGDPTSLQKLGNGTLVLAHSNNINGGVIVADGTLRLQLATGLTTATTTTVNPGGSIELPGTVAVTRLVQLNGNGFSNKGALYSSGDTSWNGGITLQSNASVGADPNDILTIPGAISGAFTLSKVGVGKLVLTSAANSFANLNVNAGTLALSSPAPIPAAATITVAAGAVVEINGNADYNRSLSLAGDGISAAGALHNLASSTIWSGPVSLPAAATIATDANTQLFVSGAISGVGALTKIGPGTLTLSGNNTYTGATTVNEGILRLQSNNALGATAGLHIPANTAAEIQLNTAISRPLFISGVGIAGAGALRSTSGANTWSGPITLEANTTIGVDPGSTLTISGQISDGAASFGLTKVGPGNLILNAGNSYDGGTVINGGTVSVISNSALGDLAGPVTTNNGGKLLFTSTTTTARTFNLSTGSIQVDAGATLFYNNATVNGGFLRGPGTHAIGSGTGLNAVTALPGTNLTQNASATVTNFTNAGNFNSSNFLNWDGGFNTGSGTLTVNAGMATTAFENDGTIIINSTGALSNLNNPLVSTGGSRITINPSGILSLNGTTLDLHGALLVNNGTINGGVTNVFFGSLAAGAGAFPGGVTVFPGGAYTPGQTLANMPAPAPIGTGLIQPLDPNQSTGTPVTLNADTTANVSAPNNSLSLGLVSGPGRTLTKTGPGTLTVVSLRAGSLNLAEGKVQIRPSGSPASLSVLDTLSFGPNTTLDLADNDLIVRNADLPALLNQLRTARAGGAWTGPGLTSSAAANDPRHVTTLAVLSNDIGAGQPLYTTFDNEAVKASDTLIKYTYYGDADANGIVNGDDYFRTDSGFLLGSHTTWLTGDFDNNSVTNIDDFFLLDLAFANQAGPLSASALTALTTAVPEPTVLATLGVLPFTLRRRHRR